MRLQRQAPDPLYQQLKASLAAEIASGRYRSRISLGVRARGIRREIRGSASSAARSSVLGKDRIRRALCADNLRRLDETSGIAYREDS